MKKCFLLLSFIILLPINVGAQVDWPYFEDNSNTILVPKKSQLYPLGWGEESVRSERAHKARVNKEREVSNYLYNKTVKISKNIELPVVGFAKLNSEQSFFDYYIVEFENKLYYLSTSDCLDNSLIENKNNSIVEHYDELKEAIESLSEEYLYQAQLKLQDAASKLQYLEDHRQHIIDSLSENAIAAKKAAFDLEIKEWENSTDSQTKRALSYIRINTAYLDTPNSAAGCDFVLNYTNMGKKTIKYLNWSGTTYNAVNDKVYCSIRNTCSFSGRDTGPIEPGEKGGGSWEAIIYNWSAKELRLNSIVITYMDGSNITIPGSAAIATKTAPNREDLLSSINFITEKSESDVDAEIRRLRRDVQYSDKPENVRLSTSALFAPEVEKYNQIRELASELRQFKKNNNLPKWDIPESVQRLKIVDLQGL